jgi:hypothetical protein
LRITNTTPWRGVRVYYDRGVCHKPGGGGESLSYNASTNEFITSEWAALIRGLRLGPQIFWFIFRKVIRFNIFAKKNEGQ